MTYSVKPNPSDFFSNSQKDIKDNFQVLNTAVSVDHEDYFSEDAGEHKKITYHDFETPPSSSGNKSFEHTNNSAQNAPGEIISQLLYQPVTNAFSPPAGQRDVPLSPKAAVVFTASPGAPVILTGSSIYNFNVLSVAETGIAGISYQILFRTSVNTINYFVQAMVNRVPGSTLPPPGFNIFGPANNGFNISFTNVNKTGTVDRIHVMVY